MISFMIIAAPRSGTTWAANWLTTDTTVCVHDPLRLYELDKLNQIPTGGKMLGVSCTGLALFSQWVNRHPAPRVVLHRPFAQINKSLNAMGFTGLDAGAWQKALDDVAGWHLDYTALFDPDQAKKIYEYLLEKPFDYQRHQLLREMQIEPEMGNVIHNPDVVRKLVQQLQGAA